MKQYATEIRKAYDTEYVKVFLLDEKRNAEIQSVLSDLDCVKRVNITSSNSPNNPSETLTVYPKRMYGGQTLNKRIVSFLDSYFCGVVDNSEAVRNEAHFEDISADAAKKLTQKLVEEPQAQVTVFYKQKNRLNYILAKGAAVSVSCRERIAVLNKELNGHGGGNDNMAQGSSAVSD
jgi:polyhydroxyalkanoate synthesis regulator phasin